MISLVNEAINRKLNSMSFTTIISGVVESIDPLSIRINDRISIGLGFIEPKSLGISDDSPNPALPFIVGDKINMIRYNNGQRFYLLGSTYSNSKLLLDAFYPVGTIYETTSPNLDTTAKMNAHFGGTWEVYGAGRVLVAKSGDTAFDTIGEIGGDINTYINFN